MGSVESGSVGVDRPTIRRHWHGSTLAQGAGPRRTPRGGRVKSVTCDGTMVAITHYDAEYHALDNECPHQGGPLGEGSIEDGLLRCPWHGWDFYPDSGETPGGFDDCVTAYPIEERADGIYVGFPIESGPGADHLRCHRRDAGQLGRPAGVGYRRTLESRSRRGAPDGSRAEASLVPQRPPRGCKSVRGVGLRQTHRPTGGVPGSRLFPAGPTTHRMEDHTHRDRGQTVTRGELDGRAVAARPRGDGAVTGSGRGTVTAPPGHYGTNRRREREWAVSDR